MLYLFIKSKFWASLVLAIKEDGSFQAKLWDEDNDGVLPHKQDVAILVQDASALEEQLGNKSIHYGESSVVVAEGRPYLKMYQQIIENQLPSLHL